MNVLSCIAREAHKSEELERDVIKKITPKVWGIVVLLAWQTSGCLSTLPVHLDRA